MTIKLEIPEGGTLVNACHCGEPCTLVECPPCDNCNVFSWQDCEVCQTDHTGGERHSIAIIFAGTEREPEYYSACVDCMSEVAG